MCDQEKQKDSMIDYLQKKNDAAEKYIKYVEETFFKFKKSTDNYIDILENKLFKREDNIKDDKKLLLFKKKLEDLSDNICFMQEKIEKIQKKHLNMIIEEDLNKLKEI